MNRQRLFRGLRIAWSVAFGILCLLLIALWMRSYHRNTMFQAKLWEAWFLECWSESGETTAEAYRDILRARGRQFGDWWWHDVELLDPLPSDLLGALEERFRWKLKAGSFQILLGVGGFRAQAPHWALALLFVTVAVIPWIRFRFSLRTLLIVTTLVAVGLGLIVCAAR